jgi:glutathione S-transferase
MNQTERPRDPTSASIVIHSGPLSMFGAKAEMAAIEKGIAWERTFVPFSISTLYEPKSSDVLRVNPKGEVPVLIDGDLEIFDSTQIFEYLEDIRPTPPLWPLDRQDRARARLLELKSDEVFFPNVVCCMPERRAAAGEQAYSDSVVRIHQYFEEMDLILAGEEYLVSEFSYADIAFYAAQFFARFLGQSPARDLRHLERWRLKLNGRESVRAVMGEMAAYLTTNGIETAI